MTQPSPHPHALAHAIAALAADLSDADIAVVTACLAGLPRPDAADAFLSAVAHPRYRASAVRVVREWGSFGGSMDGLALALALRSAWAMQLRTPHVGIEVVWTGPKCQGVQVRRTEQVLLELIREARAEIWMTSFAVYAVGALATALSAALDRGVRVCLVLESATESGGRLTFDSIDRIRAALDRRAEIFVWPAERREVSADGRTGVLHAKCAVSDEAKLFVTSANLTEQAWELNLELGLLVSGGVTPGRVVGQLAALVDSGMLVRV